MSKLTQPQTIPDAKKEVFSAPWKGSDVVLVVGGEELHVHRSMLCFQSPVFEAMLKEAKQDKIEVEGKQPSDMRDFMKLLYPSKTFKNPLNAESVLKMLQLAGEYQAEAVIEQCLEEITVTSKNAMSILPYARKYDSAMSEKCVNVAQNQVKCENLKKSFGSLNADSNLRDRVWIGKCELLEETLMKAGKTLIRLMGMASGENKSAWASAVPTAVCCFSHQVQIHEFRKARECAACLVAYKDTFCKFKSSLKNDTSALSFGGESLVDNRDHDASEQELLDLVQLIDDLLSEY